MVNDKINWKSIAETVCDKVLGKDKSPFSEEEIDFFNKKLAEIQKDVGIDEIFPIAKKLLNANILDRNVNFEILNKFPIIWQKVFTTSIDVVATEARQNIMAK